MAAASGAVRVVGHEAIFRVSDVERATDHYERLGFDVSCHDDSYAFAHRGNTTIHLAGSEPKDCGGGALYLHVDDAERLADDWMRAGFTIDGPRDEEYGKREGAHVDPDGNLIRFGSPIPE